MLVLTRKKNEAVIIDDNIEITILEVSGDQVRIGIAAPKSVSVHRKEVYLEIKEENRKASAVENEATESGVDANIKKLGSMIIKRSES